MDLTALITPIIASLISSGALITLVFYRENKRAKQLKNDVTASEQWKALFERSDNKLENANNKVTSLYEELKVIRNENNQLSTDKAVLTILKCESVGCPNRKPALGEGYKFLKDETIS